MPRYSVEWYIDQPGMDGIREMEIEAEDEESAREEAWVILFNHLTIGEVDKI